MNGTNGVENGNSRANGEGDEINQNGLPNHKNGGHAEVNGAAKINGVANTNGASISADGGFLFDPSIIRNIPWSHESQVKFKGGISAHAPGENLLIRPLHVNDYHKGFLKILGMLTSVGPVTEAQFLRRFEMMRQCPNSYYVTVIEDKSNGLVIGCATLQVEFKFIHQAGVRGRIEDVVVSDAYRGRQLGKLLLETLTILGREHVGCYKMSLECKDSLIDFYGQFGFNKDAGNNYLQQRFKD